jgi:hypothetical protein
MAIAKWIVAFAAVYGFGGVLADFLVTATVSMHMKNPHWRPHAKFHRARKSCKFCARLIANGVLS